MSVLFMSVRFVAILFGLCVFWLHFFFISTQKVSHILSHVTEELCMKLIPLRIIKDPYYIGNLVIEYSVQGIIHMNSFEIFFRYVVLF